MLAEEFVVLDGNSPVWNALRPLLEIAFRLEQGDETYMWHGWCKSAIEAFLQRLPAHCSLLVGVWEDRVPEHDSALEESQQAQETLALGCVCEVVSGEVRSLRTFEALQDDRLPPIRLLEPGYQHALELMRVARQQVAPVAWALFTNGTTWNEWLLSDDTVSIDKGKLLASLAQEGRCVLLGSQATHHHA